MSYINKRATAYILRPKQPVVAIRGTVVGETTHGVFLFTDEDRLANRRPERAEWFPFSSRITHTEIENRNKDENLPPGVITFSSFLALLVP